MGVQGCGKSLTSKAVAGFWRLPLTRLDLSAVFGQPRPEEALRGALRIAEAMAPLVLWIDEIEKGFDRGGEGPAARLLGGMVTWLQEKVDEVFVVATANQVAQLPPELPRKGRFDEIFFVDLPNVHERREIFELHLKRRGLDPASFDVDGLAKKSDKLTGSEIEQLIIAAMYGAFGRDEKPTDRDLTHALSETVSLYETFEPEIKKLREWARKRARPASTDRRKVDLFDGPGKGGAGKR
jgi:SpoVK/Ycf46/Vps4 family AAA+-type ATPase